MTEAKRCPICGTWNEHEPTPDVENYSCSTCGYFHVMAYGEGGRGIGFDGVAFDWLAACKEAWRVNHKEKKGGKYEQSD